MTDVAYVYAIVLPVETRAIPRTGINGAAVRTVHGDAIAALVSSIDDAMFHEGEVRGQQLDLAWLERIARSHDDVINAAAAVTPTIPLRLGTTCADDNAVADLLNSLEPAASRTFDRLAGRAEWAVHVFAAAPAGDDSGARHDESGTAFLERRRAALERQEAEDSADESTGRMVFESLAAVAVEARLQPRQDPRLRHDPRKMIINAAYLVDRAATDVFSQEVERLRAVVGADRIEVSGPWAPYSFAELPRA